MKGNKNLTRGQNLAAHAARAYRRAFNAARQEQPNLAHYTRWVRLSALAARAIGQRAPSSREAEAAVLANLNLREQRKGRVAWINASSARTADGRLFRAWWRFHRGFTGGSIYGIMGASFGNSAKSDAYDSLCGVMLLTSGNKSVGVRLWADALGY